jgi:endonuclease/exonuclease/phosphatase family metal-dependent hydrolase
MGKQTQSSSEPVIAARMRILPYFAAAAALACAPVTDSEPNQDEDLLPPTTLRVATYNAALVRDDAGELASDLADGGDSRARRIASVIQTIRPDVLVLQEFDRDETALQHFLQLYVEVAQGELEPITYAYNYQPLVNTGVPSGLDLNDNGSTSDPEDALGYGAFPGQYGFVVLSSYPIDSDNIRTLGGLLWKDIDGALLPVDPATGVDWYSADQLAVLPVSSKNHVDVPIETPDGVLHVLAAHPTPPVFDGDEDRNGKRNHDEIRLLAEYIDGTAAWLVDDAGTSGGLASGVAFVAMGDMNADPVDGDSIDAAINQLLEHDLVHASVATGDLVPTSEVGDHHTADFDLRVDYVLPSASLNPTASGVYWPTGDEAGATDVTASDHRLVWVDLTF